MKTLDHYVFDVGESKAFFRHWRQQINLQHKLLAAGQRLLTRPLTAQRQQRLDRILELLRTVNEPLLMVDYDSP